MLFTDLKLFLLALGHALSASATLPLRFFSTHRSAGAPPVSATNLQWREVTRMLWEDQAGTLDLDEVDFSNTVLGRC